MDLRLISFMVPIDELRYGEPRGGKLSVVCEKGGLLATTEVQINGRSVGFTVVSDTELSADVPSDVDTIHSVQVYTPAVFKGDKQRVLPGLGEQPSIIAGTEQLTQQLVMQLYKDPGSDVFNPEDGAGLLSALLSPQNLANQQFLVAEISRVVERAAKQLRRKQMQYRNRLRPWERLLSAEVESTEYNPDTAAVSVIIAVITEAGRAVFSLEL